MFPSSSCARHTGVAPTSALFSDSTGTSATDATRNLAKPRLELGLDQRPCVLEGDAVEDVAEEALDDHPLGRGLGDSTRAQIKHGQRVHWPHGRAVGTAHIVVVDLEH